MDDLLAQRPAVVRSRSRCCGVAGRRTEEELTPAPRGIALTEDQVRHALANNRSVAAAARTLGVGRAALTARAQHYGLLAGPDVPADLAKRYKAGASIRDLSSTTRSDAPPSPAGSTPPARPDAHKDGNPETADPKPDSPREDSIHESAQWPNRQGPLSSVLAS